jgi:hypothetical protein
LTEEAEGLVSRGAEGKEEKTPLPHGFKPLELSTENREIWRCCKSVAPFLGMLI